MLRVLKAAFFGLSLPACSLLFGVGDEQESIEDAAIDSGLPTCTVDFCADFEQTSVLEGWTVAEVTGTGKVTRASDASAPTPPGIFLSEVSVPVPPSSAPYHAARLSYQESIDGFELETPQLRIAFSFRVDEFVDNPGVTITGVRYGADEHYVVVAINPDSSSNERVEVSYFFVPEGIVKPLGSIAIGDWVDLEITIPRRASELGDPVSGGVTFVLNEAPVTDFLPPAVLTDDMRFDVGLATTNPDARRAAVAYDAVRITDR